MVKYTEIIKAINNKIKAKFPIIPIVSESDVEEKIVRPSFMTTLDGINQQDFMGNVIDKTLTIRVFYFSSTRDKNKIENLGMIDSLNEIFLEDNQIEANGFRISIGETDVNIVDKVLEYNFEISFSEDYERDYSDIGEIEEIEMDVKGGE